MKSDAKRIVLRPTDASLESASFVVYNPVSKAISRPRTAPIQKIAKAAAGMSVSVLVPATDVLLTRAQLPPAKSRDRLLRALPYAVEEQLAEDVETVHIAAGEPDADGVPVAVVALEQMTAWSDAFLGAGLSVQSMTSDALAVPWQQGRRTLLVESGRSTLRTGQYEGVSVEHAAVPLLLQSSADQSPVDVYDYTNAAPDGWFAGLAVERHQAKGDPIALLSKGLTADTVELLQGAYSTVDHGGKTQRTWRLAAVAGAACIASYALYCGVEWWQLDQRATTLQQQSQRIYREATGAKGPILDAERQFRSFVQQQDLPGQSGGAFLKMVTAVGPELAGIEELRLNSLNYRDGGLELSIAAPTVSAVERLRGTLAATTGFSVELLSATSDAASVSGRLRIAP